MKNPNASYIIYDNGLISIFKGCPKIEFSAICVQKLSGKINFNKAAAKIAPNVQKIINNIPSLVLTCPVNIKLNVINGLSYEFDIECATHNIIHIITKHDNPYPMLSKLSKQY